MQTFFWNSLSLSLSSLSLYPILFSPTECSAARVDEDRRSSNPTTKLSFAPDKKPLRDRARENQIWTSLKSFQERERELSEIQENEFHISSHNMFTSHFNCHLCIHRLWVQNVTWNESMSLEGRSVFVRAWSSARILKHFPQISL